MVALTAGGSALSSEAVAAAAYLGGFRGNDIVEAVKVAFGESSWNPQAKNSCCHGLWQINLLVHPGMSNNVYDPVQNAKYAYTIFRGAGGWCTNGKPPNGCNPWQAYGGSNYKSAGPKAIEGYMALQTDMKNGKTPAQILAANPQSIPGLDLNPSSIVSDATKPITDTVTAVTSGFNRMGTWITNPDNLTRIFKVIVGGVVILVGAAALMDKQAVPMAVNVAKQTVPAVRAVQKLGVKK